MGSAALGGLVAMSFTFDALLFPAAGYLMDTCGRKWAGVPSLIGFTISFALLAVSSSKAAVWVSGALMGVSNGLTSGFLQVLGADLAPPDARSQFLGLWKSVTSGGNLLGPITIGLISEACGGLGASAAFVAALTASGAAFYAFVGAETLQRSKHPAASGEAGR